MGRFTYHAASLIREDVNQVGSGGSEFIVDIREQAEALSITKFKTTGAKRPPGRLGPAPPPPKPKPSRFSGAPAAETVTALYDYEAQAEGDLSFITGDVIKIVTRTNNENEW